MPYGKVRAISRAKAQEKVELSPVLYLEPEGASVEFRIGITTKYILKDIPGLYSSFIAIPV